MRHIRPHTIAEHGLGYCLPWRPVHGAAGSRPATEIVLKDGRAAAGQTGQGRRAGRIAAALPARRQRTARQLIIFLDDELRRTFFSERLIDPTRGPPGGEPAGRGEVRHPPAGAARRHGGQERRPAAADPALRRVRPPHLHHAHRQGAGRRRPGHHRADAPMDEGRGHLARLGHADRHQFHPPRHPAQNPPEADQSEERSSTTRRSPGSISSASVTRRPGRSWTTCWRRFPTRPI